MKITTNKHVHCFNVHKNWGCYTYIRFDVIEYIPWKNNSETLDLKYLILILLVIPVAYSYKNWYSERKDRGILKNLPL